ANPELRAAATPRFPGRTDLGGAGRRLPPPRPPAAHAPPRTDVQRLRPLRGKRRGTNAGVQRIGLGVRLADPPRGRPHRRRPLYRGRPVQALGAAGLHPDGCRRTPGPEPAPRGSVWPRSPATGRRPVAGADARRTLRGGRSLPAAAPRGAAPAAAPGPRHCSPRQLHLGRQPGQRPGEIGRRIGQDADRAIQAVRRADAGQVPPPRGAQPDAAVPGRPPRPNPHRDGLRPGLFRPGPPDPVLRPVHGPHAFGVPAGRADGTGAPGQPECHCPARL
ncbi:MAG: hypothetical protein AVDCRST_MAG56-1932, partial [uncultured Cytophagales bacterium]